MINLNYHLLVFLKLSALALCCLYKGRQVETSLENSIFVESARSTIECTLQCQRLKKTTFYTDDEKCYCLVAFIDGTNVEQGITFEKVNLL